MTSQRAHLFGKKKVYCEGVLMYIEKKSHMHAVAWTVL